MTTRRKLLSAGIAGIGLSVIPAAGFGQSQGKVYRIGILFSGTPATSKHYRDAFMQGLRELGYVEHKNAVFDFRYAEGVLEHLPKLAEELVQRKVDLILTNNMVSTAAAKKATPSIPIVFGAANDPVGNGLVTSLAKPGGNITGTTNIAGDLNGKRLQLLKEAFPKTARIAAMNPRIKEAPRQYQQVQEAAKVLRLDILPFDLLQREDIDTQCELLRGARTDAMYVLENPVNLPRRELFLALSAKCRLPAMYGQASYTEAGGLMSYGPDYTANFHRCAAIADKIFKGAKPADIPVEIPAKFEFVLNLKSARSLGVTFPQSILIQATKVIE